MAGWRWSPKSGIMGSDYLFRAAWAKWYTGGNTPADSFYLNLRLYGPDDSLAKRS